MHSNKQGKKGNYKNYKGDMNRGGNQNMIDDKANDNNNMDYNQNNNFRFNNRRKILTTPKMMILIQTTIQCIKKKKEKTMDYQQLNSNYKYKI